MALLQGVVKFHTGGDAAFRFRKADESANGAEKRRRTGQNPVPTVKSGWKKQAASAFVCNATRPRFFGSGGVFPLKPVFCAGQCPGKEGFYEKRKGEMAG